MVSSTLRPHFTPGKDAVPIVQEAGWAPGPAWTGGKSRPHRDSIPDRPARSSVAIPTELPGPQIHVFTHIFLFCIMKDTEIRDADTSLLLVQNGSKAGTRNTNVLYYVYKMCDCYINLTDIGTDLGVQLDPKLHLRYIFSLSVKMLSLISALNLCCSVIYSLLKVVFSTS